MTAADCVEHRGLIDVHSVEILRRQPIAEPTDRVVAAALACARAEDRAQMTSRSIAISKNAPRTASTAAR